MSALTLLSPETIERGVLVAVELFDPVILANVTKGLTVRAAGLGGKPILSWSGRYVWLREADLWPTRYEVSVDAAPYQTAEYRSFSLTVIPKPLRLWPISPRSPLWRIRKPDQGV